MAEALARHAKTDFEVEAERREFVHFAGSTYVAPVATFVHLMKPQAQGRHLAGYVEADAQARQGKWKGNITRVAMDDEALLPRFGCTACCATTKTSA